MFNTFFVGFGGRFRGVSWNFQGRGADEREASHFTIAFARMFHGFSYELLLRLQRLAALRGLHEGLLEGT